MEQMVLRLLLLNNTEKVKHKDTPCVSDFIGSQVCKK